MERGDGYPYTVSNGLVAGFSCFVVAGALFLLFNRRANGAARFAAVRVGFLFIVGCGLYAYIALLGSEARYGMPVWLTLLPACGLLLDELLCHFRKATLALASACVCLAMSMIALRPLLTLAGRIDEGDMSRSFYYGIPPLYDHLPPGTVVLNLGHVTKNYPLLGTKLSNCVIENMADDPLDGLEQPLSQVQLDAYHVELVHVEGSEASVFEADVRYDVIYEDPTVGRDLRVYRILR